MKQYSSHDLWIKHHYNSHKKIKDRYTGVIASMIIKEISYVINIVNTARHNITEKLLDRNNHF